jgi:hypothetical protein
MSRQVHPFCLPSFHPHSPDFISPVPPDARSLTTYFQMPSLWPYRTALKCVPIPELSMPLHDQVTKIYLLSLEGLYCTVLCNDSKPLTRVLTLALNSFCYDPHANQFPFPSHPSPSLPIPPTTYPFQYASIHPLFGKYTQAIFDHTMPCGVQGIPHHGHASVSHAPKSDWTYYTIVNCIMAITR